MNETTEAHLCVKHPFASLLQYLIVEYLEGQLESSLTMMSRDRYVVLQMRIRLGSRPAGNNRYDH